jgi:chromosome partitioning protein
MARIFAIVNQKGGVGKTTTAVSVAACLADEGHRVLLVDSDAQAHAGKSIGFDNKEIDVNLYNVFSNKASAARAIYSTDYKNLDLLPSDISLSALEVELSARTGKEFLLERAMKVVEHNYDFIIIDCPPFLGILTINALIASTDVIITCTMSYLSLEGVSDLLDLVEVINDTLYLPKKVFISGVLACMYDSRTRISRRVLKELERYFKEQVFDTLIPVNVKLNESQIRGVPIIYYAPDSKGALAYKRLTREILRRLEEQSQAGE